MEPDATLPRSQEPATTTFPHLHESNPQRPIYFPKIYFNIILSMNRSSEWSLPFKFSKETFVGIS
jgi:hypothetical protein